MDYDSPVVIAAQQERPRAGTLHVGEHINVTSPSLLGTLPVTAVYSKQPTQPCCSTKRPAASYTTLAHLDANEWY